jgi:hypothetical protein
MSLQPEIEEAVDEVMLEYDQPEEFRDKFVNFYENTLENNIGRSSLKRLIEKVELPEEEELDGSQD